MRFWPSVVVSIFVHPQANKNKISIPVNADLYWVLDT
jgi:hypothetical protein